MNKKFVFLAYSIFLSIAISLSPAFAQGYAISEVQTPFNFNDIGNNTTGGPQYWTASANYTLWAVVQATGAEVAGADDGTGAPNIVFNVTFVMPYGINPANQGNCNSTVYINSTFANKNGTLNATNVACTRGPFNFTPANANGKLNVTLNVTPNISAMSSGALYQGAADAGGTRAPALIYAILNATNNSSTPIGVSSAPTQHNTTSFWVNPRPYGHTVTGTYNATLYITNWDQTDPFYVMNVPLMKFNQSKGRPDPAEDNFAEILYMNATMMEKPGYMRLFSYNLTFKFVLPTTVSTGEGNYIAFNITSPVSGASYANETLMPLLIQNLTAFSPEGNFSMVMGVPSQLGFTIWHNNSSGGGLGNYYTIAEMLSTFGVSLSYNPGSQQLLVNFTTNASANWANNTEFSMLFTLMNGTSGTSTPIYVQRQILSGMDMNSPPPLGANITTSNFINISNTLANYTLRDIRIRFMMPMNVSVNESGTNSSFKFNLTSLGNATGRHFDYATHDWNNSWSGFINTTSNANLTDNMPGSPAKGANISIWFMYADINITNGTFNNWMPKSLGNATINFSAFMSFPTMNETPIADSTSGNKNYTATLQMSMQGRINLTSKVPGLNNNSNGIVVVLDGQTLAPDSGNYTIGSLLLDNVGSGSHTVQVTYSVPFSKDAGGGGSGGSGGAAGVIVQDVVSENKPVATVSFNVGESATFSVGGESHSLKVDSIVGGSVTIIISSTPFKVQAQVNRPAYVDVDNDGDNDIIVTVLEILSNTAAKIKIEYLAQAAKKTTKSGAQSEIRVPEIVPELAVPQETPSTGSAISGETPKIGFELSMTMIFVLVALLIVIGLAVYYWMYK